MVLYVRVSDSDQLRVLELILLNNQVSHDLVLYRKISSWKMFLVLSFRVLSCYWETQCRSFCFPVDRTGSKKNLKCIKVNGIGLRMCPNCVMLRLENHRDSDNSQASASLLTFAKYRKIESVCIDPFYSHKAANIALSGQLKKAAIERWFQCLLWFCTAVYYLRRR